MFSPDQVIKLDHERAVWREVASEIVVLDLKTSEYFSLNGSGALLWKRLEVGATPAELAEELVCVYGIPLGQAMVDAGSLLGDLQAQSLVVADQ